MAVGLPFAGRLSAAGTFANGGRIAVACCVVIGLFVLRAPAPAAEAFSPVENSQEMISLGEQLFRSPLLSLDSSISCQSCHIPALGFSGNRPLAIGVAGYVSGRRAPSLLGLARSKNLMWDGRARDLRSQIAIPLQSPEMGIVWPAAISRLRGDPAIDELAKRAGLSEIDRDSVLSALAAYVGSLEAGKTRFDSYYFDHDTQALNQQEIIGLRLFTHKARCAGCHLVNAMEAPFTDDAFHSTGIGCGSGSCADHGRAAISGNPADEGAFKTPSLRGVVLRPFLMHDGSVSSLRAAIERYNRGIALGPDRLDARLGPLYLTADEVNALVAFLGALAPTAPVTPKKFTNDGR